MKTKSHFICSSCGNESLKWAGKCPFCSEWNTLVEFKETATHFSKKSGTKSKQVDVKKFSDFQAKPVSRTSSGFEEVDRVLGGGLVSGEVLLVGGDPGVGKSTLLLSIVDKMASTGLKMIYLSGEESGEQISLRASRMKVRSDNIFFISETEAKSVVATLEKEKPDLVIIDSIQTVYLEDVDSLPGSVPQLRAAAMVFIEFAKRSGVPIVFIGHVTKDGSIAGPQILTHMVDAVFQLEGDSNSSFRFLRSIKNRFGPTEEVGVFEMREDGLKEIRNPSEFFLAGRQENAIGSVVASTLEGTRPVMAEIQALTSFTSFGYPRRTSAGVSLNRVQLLIAVLCRHSGLKLDSQDVYVNVVGGFQIRERAVDLAIALAVAGSFLKKPVSPNLVVLGEVGLSGEVRMVPRMEGRAREAEKLGFTKILGPKLGKDVKLKLKNAKYIEVRNISDVITQLKNGTL